MKPTKMRNSRIYRAGNQTRSKQLGSALSKDLQKKYGKRSVRVTEGDGVTIVRGEFAGVDGKVSQISTQKSSVAIEGIKKEQTRGEKYDVYIHTSNLVVKSLSTEDRWRIARLEGKDPRKQPKPAKEETAKEEPKATKEESAKETPKETKETPKEAKEETVKEAPKETKAEEKAKKEDEK